MRTAAARSNAEALGALRAKVVAFSVAVAAVVVGAVAFLVASAVPAESLDTTRARPSRRARPLSHHLS